MREEENHVKNQSAGTNPDFDWGDYPPLIRSLTKSQEWLILLLKHHVYEKDAIEACWKKVPFGLPEEGLISEVSKYAVIIQSNEVWHMTPGLIGFQNEAISVLHRSVLRCPVALSKKQIHLELTKDGTQTSFFNLLSSYNTAFESTDFLLTRLLSTLPGIMAEKRDGYVVYSIDKANYDEEYALFERLFK